VETGGSYALVLEFDSGDRTLFQLGRQKKAKIESFFGPVFGPELAAPGDSRVDLALVSSPNRQALFH
jgi:hypothetical protein